MVSMYMRIVPMYLRKMKGIIYSIMTYLGSFRISSSNCTVKETLLVNISKISFLPAFIISCGYRLVLPNFDCILLKIDSQFNINSLETTGCKK